MYTLNIVRAIKLYMSMKSEILSLNTIIRGIGFFKECSYCSIKKFEKNKIYRCLKTNKYKNM